MALSETLKGFLMRRKPLCTCVHMCASHSFHVEDSLQDIVQHRKSVEGLRSLDPCNTYRCFWFIIYTTWASRPLYENILYVRIFAFSSQESKATNVDHLTTVLYLHLAVFSSMQSWGQMVLCLQKLISLHPLNPWSWYKLAEAYLSMPPGPDLPAGVSPQGQKSSTSSGKAVGPSSVHLGTGSLLSFPETLPESTLFSMEASGCNTQKNMQNCLARRREEAQMEARRKACASLIRAR